MIDAEEAIGKALEVARKANLPVLFTTAVSATKKDSMGGNNRIAWNG